MHTGDLTYSLLQGELIQRTTDCICQERFSSRLDFLHVDSTFFGVILVEPVS